MDLATDIAASMEELHRKKRAFIFRAGAFRLSVGRKVIGTMSTTLLLAYTGGYTSLLMCLWPRACPGEHVHHVLCIQRDLPHPHGKAWGWCWWRPSRPWFRRPSFPSRTPAATLAVAPQGMNPRADPGPEPFPRDTAGRTRVPFRRLGDAFPAFPRTFRSGETQRYFSGSCVNLIKIFATWDGGRSMLFFSQCWKRPSVPFATNTKEYSFIV